MVQSSARFPGPNGTRLSSADSLTVIGGAGIVSQLTGTGGALAALVPSKPAASLKVICDGCVIPDVEPRISVATQPCRSAADCPPRTILQIGLALWHSKAAAIGWRALLADTLLPAVQLPLLTQQPQYDPVQLRQNRAWPATSADEAYIAAFGGAVRTALRRRPHEGLFTFSVACSPPQASLFRSADDFFCRPVSCSLQRGGNQTEKLRLASMTSMFLKDPEFAPVCVEDCGGFDCNAYCAMPSCWG